MTDIKNANYLYDAQGRTIAFKRNEKTEIEEKVNEFYGVDAENREFEHEGDTWYETFDFEGDENIKGKAAILENARTIEDFTVNEITSMFLNGNLTVEELHKGLASKANFSEDDWSAQEDGQHTIIRYTIDGKEYKLNCLTEMCLSQTDRADSQGAHYYLESLKHTQPNRSPKVNQPETSHTTGNVETVTSSSGISLDAENTAKENGDMDKSWTTDDLVKLGLDINFYLNAYFDQNSDGSYSLKSAATLDGKAGLYVEGKFVNDIETLKDTLGVITLDEYYNNLVEDYCCHDFGAEGMVQIWSMLTGSARGGVYAYEDYIKSHFGKSVNSLSNAEIVKLLTDEAIKEGRTQNVEWQQEKSLRFFKEMNIRNSLMFDNAFLNLEFGAIENAGGTYHYPEKTPAEFFTEVALSLEDDSPDKGLFNHTVWNAILEAANVSDSDNIETRANKIGNYMYSFGNDWNDLFQHFMETGLLAQNSYSEEELLNQFTEDEIKENFYLETDASGNSTGVYKLKHGSSLLPDTIGECITTQSAGEGKPVHGVTIASAKQNGYSVVTNAEELKEALIANPNAVVVLANDIDMSGVDWIPVGTADNPFNGVIYGNNYTIKNLNVESNNQYSGMFGVFGGEAYDLKMENCTVKDTRGDNVAGLGGTGIFAGLITNHIGRYPNNMYGTDRPIGGVCNNIEIINGNVYGRDNAGLLAGIAEPKGDDYANLGCPITEICGGITCNVSGTVYSENTAGGIVGKLDGKNGGYIIGTCNADVNGQVWAGGLVGQADNNAKCDGEYKGAVNKDIKNPPGAMGAAFAVGRCDNTSECHADYDKYDTKENKTSKIYNTYAHGTIIGWLCTLNEDGSVKETLEYPKELAYDREFGKWGAVWDNENNRRVFWAGASQSMEVGKAAGIEPIIFEEENDPNVRRYNVDIQTDNGIAHDLCVETSQNNVVPNECRDEYPFENIVKTVTETKNVEAATKPAATEEQEQYIKDPTYLDVVKQVILQNFVEHYDVSNPNNQLIWDQLSKDEYVTRANYKEMIERVRERTGLTDDELVQRTIDKLLEECINMDPRCKGIVETDTLKNDSWLKTLVAAMDGVVTSFNKPCLPDKDGNCALSSMSFEVDNIDYFITFDPFNKMEFIASDELISKLKATGASNDDITNAINLLCHEAVSKKYKNGEKEILKYNFAGYPDMYSSFFSCFDDIVKYFAGEDDAYTHYWNSLLFDKDYRTEVLHCHSGDVFNASLKNSLYDTDGKLYAGLYIYSAFSIDGSTGKRKYTGKESLRIWDPAAGTVVDTGLSPSVFNNGMFDWEAIKAGCKNAHILSLLEAYINRKAPTESSAQQRRASEVISDSIDNTPVDIKTPSEDTDIITIDEYEKEAKEAATQKGLIRDDKTGLFSKYDSVTNQTYNWLWNPFTKSFDIYTDSELETSAPDERINRIKRRRQAILQRLSQTVNPNVCKDKEGNFYDYNEKTGLFELRK